MTDQQSRWWQKTIRRCAWVEKDTFHKLEEDTVASHFIVLFQPRRITIVIIIIMKLQI